MDRQHLGLLIVSLIFFVVCFWLTEAALFDIEDIESRLDVCESKLELLEDRVDWYEDAVHEIICGGKS